MKKTSEIIIFSISLIALITGCKGGSSKNAFDNKVDEVPFHQYQNAEYHSVTKITYLGYQNEESRDLLAFYSEEERSWVYHNDEENPEAVEYIWIPNIKYYTAEEIYKQHAPRLDESDYTIDYSYSTNPLSFTVTVKGKNKKELSYKDYKGQLSCEFNDGGWLVHMTGYFDRYMVNTKSNYVENLQLDITYS